MTAERDAELADEIALGLLEGRERDEAERRLERDPALARAVGSAQDRFLPLDLAVAPVTPAAATWSAIVSRIATTPAPVSREAPRAQALSPAARRPRRVMATLMALAASVLLAGALGWALRGAADPLAVAVLEADDGRVIALVEDFGDGNVDLTPLADVTVASGESLQVWTKWSEEAGPVSVGVLDDLLRVDLEAVLPDPVAGQLYEITREPLGGSPTGRPTGPIVAKGLAAAT